MIFRTLLSTVLIFACVQLAQAQPGFPNGPGSPSRPGMGGSIPGMNNSRPSMPGAYRPPNISQPPNFTQPSSSFRPPTTPDFSTPSTIHDLGAISGPKFSSPNIPHTPPAFGGYETVYECSNCRREVSAVATKCPHCGVRFGSTGTSGFSGRGMGRLIGFGVLIVFGLISFVVRMIRNQ